VESRGEPSVCGRIREDPDLCVEGRTSDPHGEDLIMARKRRRKSFGSSTWQMTERLFARQGRYIRVPGRDLARIWAERDRPISDRF
jgi:hypothetical protein